MGATETAPCRLAVSKNRIEASLVIHPDVPPHTISRAMLLQPLKEASIKITPEVDQKLDALLSMISGGHLPAEPFLVAVGRPMEPGKNGCFELDPGLLSSIAPKNEGEHVDYHKASHILSVVEGQVLGRIHPPEPVVIGEDVCGHPIKPAAKLREVQPGRNTRFAEDGVTVLASRDGRIKYDSHSVEVLDVLEIRGDVDFSTGSIDATNEVIVRGNVLDLFSVKCKGSVEVAGNVEAADVCATGEVIVRGGICGKEKGKVVSEKGVQARFASGAHIEAGEDITISKEAINCTLMAKGVINIPKGSLIGGRSHARNGGSLGVVGSEAGIRTHLGIGMNPEVFGAITAIDQKVKALHDTAKHIRTQVQPLLANIRRLNAQQREKATELMYQADDLDAQTEPLMLSRKELIDQTAPIEGASLIVTNQIFAGVCITVDNYELRFEKEVRGPVKIEKRKIENVTEIVIVNQLTGSVTIFPARKLDVPDLHSGK